MPGFSAGRFGRRRNMVRPGHLRGRPGVGLAASDGRARIYRSELLPAWDRGPNPFSAGILCISIIAHQAHEDVRKGVRSGILNAGCLRGV